MTKALKANEVRAKNLAKKQTDGVKDKGNKLEKSQGERQNFFDIILHTGGIDFLIKLFLHCT